MIAINTIHNLEREECGQALRENSKVKRSDQVTCVFMGNAVAETGVSYESLNFAVLRENLRDARDS